ncbi:SusC/RagA family TonB-linked outer membrane protein [Desertivirga arenae]|uniref:SusC/RagA family TonB-linked outer membrane protein n=1 Tax=Desertivirga arenae TaxID=2810309 RepID=UPI001A95C32D|nr:SusC/RagA family TonB-linked outer membrane protein [Pedobacter sp. SYSU D00823]
MMNFLLTYVKGILLLFFLLSGVAQAQTALVKGQVLSLETNKPLAGVSIKVKGTNRGTSSDLEGKFSINANSTETLIATFIGYTSEEVLAREASVIYMASESKALNEVVVTALGIKREEKSLGYAAQSLKNDAVTDARTTNWVNSLSGKVAGLNIQGTGSGPVSSSRITLRGESSLNLDNNQALIVVDGIPVSNKITGTGFKAHLATDSPVDFGSSMSDINPDDIETVTVLKGAGATALYGSRAASGAIIITTKSGKAQKGIGVTYNTTVSFDQVNRWPDYQFEYGEGRTDSYYSYGNTADGMNTSTTASAGRAWGPKFDGQMYYQYNPSAADGISTERTPWVADKNYISDYFKTGRTLTNSVNLEGGSDKGSIRASITHMTNDWIVENTGFKRLTTALSANYKLTDKLKVSAKANYTNKKSDNLPSAGYNNQTLMYFLIIGTAPNIKADWFKPMWKPGLEGVQQFQPFNPGPDNPYIEMYEVLNTMNRHGIVGGLTANYTFSPKLELMVRSGLDLAFEYRSQQRPYSITRYPRGMYREQNVFSNEINTDALLTFKDKIGSDVSFSISGGGNIMSQTYDFAGMYADQLAQPGIYQISNSLDQAVADPLKTRKSIHSAYGLAQFSFKDRIFVDLTGRNDWSSALPYKNNSFFYPSVSTSFIANEIFNLPKAISYAKLRLSLAQVGNDTRPYQDQKYYDRIYSNSFTNPSTLYNPDLQPEITTSTEAGLDVRLFQNRLGLDLAIYNNNSKNQILAVPLDQTSGYSSALVNAGLINSRGLEVSLNGKPVKGKKFNWSTTLNWAANRSYVRELREGITSQILYSHESNVSIEARVGGRMGDLYGKGFQRAPDGQIIYTTEGVPATPDPLLRKWGNAFPDWKAGLMNEFSFKNVRISALIEGQAGGSMYSQTNHKNNTLGKTMVTLPGRDEGIIGLGVVKQTDGSFVPNTTRVKAMTYYDNYYQIGNAETNIFSTDFLKLREARIEWDLPKKLLNKVHLNATTLALYGRDLFVITKFPAFDPEGGNLNAGTLTPGVELAQFPSARTFGLNATFKF